MHVHRHEDNGGNLTDLTYFCSDWCHKDWCRATGQGYEGWDGCHETDTAQECANCHEPIGTVYTIEEVTA
jgi:hypothetical protein